MRSDSHEEPCAKVDSKAVDLVAGDPAPGLGGCLEHDGIHGALPERVRRAEPGQSGADDRNFLPTAHLGRKVLAAGNVAIMPRLACSPHSRRCFVST